MSMKIISNNKYKILSFVSTYVFLSVVALSLLTSVLFVQADTTVSNPGTQTGVNINATIKNPLSDSISDIPSFIEAILNIVLTIGVPIVALAIIYCGFLFVTAQGSAEKITKAKKALMFTLIGAALLLGSWILATAIKGTVLEIQKSA